MLQIVTAKGNPLETLLGEIPLNPTKGRYMHIPNPHTCTFGLAELAIEGVAWEFGIRD